MTNKATRHDEMYGARHRRLRREWKVKVDAGGISCWRCHLPVLPGSRWHLDHLPGGAPDQYVYPVPVAHPRCNELGVLPGTTTITTQIAPTGPGRGRATAEDRMRRSLPVDERPSIVTSGADPIEVALIDGWPHWRGGVSGTEWRRFPPTEYLRNDPTLRRCENSPQIVKANRHRKADGEWSAILVPEWVEKFIIQEKDEA